MHPKSFSQEGVDENVHVVPDNRCRVQLTSTCCACMLGNLWIGCGSRSPWLRTDSPAGSPKGRRVAPPSIPVLFGQVFPGQGRGHKETGQTAGPFRIKLPAGIALQGNRRLAVPRRCRLQREAGSGGNMFQSTHFHSFKSVHQLQILHILRGSAVGALWPCCGGAVQAAAPEGFLGQCPDGVRQRYRSSGADISRLFPPRTGVKSCS